jgi:xanthine/uracil permease
MGGLSEAAAWRSQWYKTVPKSVAALKSNPVIITHHIVPSEMSRLLVASAWAAAAVAQTFTNPVLFQDLADADIFRVNDTFYYSASNMHFSPGAPLLRSYDLVN